MKTNGYDTSHNSYTDTLAYTDIIIFKLSIHGDSLKGATFFGGSNHDGLTDGALKYNYADEFRGEVLTDKANNVYLVSSTNSDSLPLKNASKSSLEGPADGLCLKFSKGLDTLLWSTYFGGKEVMAFTVWNLIKMKTYTWPEVHSVIIYQLPQVFLIKPTMAELMDLWLFTTKKHLL